MRAGVSDRAIQTDSKHTRISYGVVLIINNSIE